MTTETAAEVTTESAPVEDEVTLDTATDTEELAPSEQAAKTEEPAPSEPEESAKYQARMNKITREKHEAERKSAALEGRIAELESAATTTAVKDVPPIPKEEDFDYDPVAYNAAVVTRDKVITDNARAQGTIDATTKMEGEKALADRHTLERGFADKINTFITDNPDAEKALGDAASMIANPALGAALMNDPKGAEILHELGKDLTLLDELNRLGEGPVYQRIERLSAGIKAPPKPKTTEAPEPVTTLGGGGSLPSDLEKFDVGATFE